LNGASINSGSTGINAVNDANPTASTPDLVNLFAANVSGGKPAVIAVTTGENANIINPTLTLYASDAPHPSGYGDGQYLLGILLKFDPRQNVTFAAKGDWRGKWVTGTVTRNFYYGFLTAGPAPTSEFPDTHSTTSEFSRAVKVE